MTAIQDLTNICNSAIAADGGSIYLCLSDPSNNQLNFTINRSIKSRGTKEFNQVTDSNGPLIPSSVIELKKKLEMIQEEAITRGNTNLALDLFLSYLSETK
jgi:hypothetical protein